MNCIFNSVLTFFIKCSTTRFSYYSTILDSIVDLNVIVFIMKSYLCKYFFSIASEYSCHKKERFSL